VLALGALDRATLPIAEANQLSADCDRFVGIPVLSPLDIAIDQASDPDASAVVGSDHEAAGSIVLHLRQRAGRPDWTNYTHG
jgi:hypothetical protein